MGCSNVNHLFFSKSSHDYGNKLISLSPSSTRNWIRLVAASLSFHSDRAVGDTAIWSVIRLHQGFRLEHLPETVPNCGVSSSENGGTPSYGLVWFRENPSYKNRMMTGATPMTLDTLRFVVFHPTVAVVIFWGNCGQVVPGTSRLSKHQLGVCSDSRTRTTKYWLLVESPSLIQAHEQMDSRSSIS